MCPPPLGNRVDICFYYQREAKLVPMPGRHKALACDTKELAAFLLTYAANVQRRILEYKFALHPTIVMIVMRNVVQLLIPWVYPTAKSFEPKTIYLKTKGKL